MPPGDSVIARLDCMSKARYTYMTWRIVKYELKLTIRKYPCCQFNLSNTAEADYVEKLQNNNYEINNLLILGVFIMWNCPLHDPVKPGVHTQYWAHLLSNSTGAQTGSRLLATKPIFLLLLSTCRHPKLARYSAVLDRCIWSLCHLSCPL